MVNKQDEILARKAITFIEELVWLLDAQRGLKLKDVPRVLRQALVDPSSAGRVAAEYTSPNPNIHFLIGVLPRLFQDEKLFPNNALIAKFATEVLEIPVSRFEKRSKYELIGLIACETDKLSDQKLAHLVRALASLTGNEEKMRRMQEAEKTNEFSWNEAIQSLGGNTEQED